MGDSQCIRIQAEEKKDLDGISDKFPQFPSSYQLTHKWKREKSLDYDTKINQIVCVESDLPEHYIVKIFSSASPELSKSLAFQEYETMKIYLKDHSSFHLRQIVKEKSNTTIYKFAVFLRFNPIFLDPAIPTPEKAISWLKSLTKSLIRLHHKQIYPITISENQFFLTQPEKIHFSYLETNAKVLQNPQSPYTAPELNQLNPIKNPYKKAIVFSLALQFLTIFKLFPSKIDSFSLASSISQVPEILQNILSKMLEIDPCLRISPSKLLIYLNSLSVSTQFIQKNASCKDKLKYLKNTQNLEIWDKGAVMCATIIKSSKIILSGGSDGNICIWSIPLNTLIATLKSHAHGVLCLKVTQNECLAISAGKDSKVRIWSLATYQLLHSLSGHRGFIVCLALTSDDKSAISGGEDGGIRIWNIEKGQLEFELSGHGINWREYFGVTCMDIVKGNQLLITGGDDGYVRVWRLGWKCQEGAIEGHVSQFEGVFEGTTCILAMGNAEFAVSGGEDGYIRIWDIVMKNQSNSLQAFKSERYGGVRCIVITSDDEIVIAGGRDGRIVAFHIESNSVKADIQAHEKLLTGGVHTMALNLDSTILATGGIDTICKVWNVKSWDLLLVFNGHSGIVNGVNWIENTVVSQSIDGSVKVWEANTGLESCNFIGHNGPISCIDISPDLKFAACTGKQAGIKVWNIQKKKIKFELPGHNHWVSCLSFTDNSKFLISADADGTIKLWNLFHKQLFAEVKACEAVIVVVKTIQNGKKIVSIGENNEFCVWDFKTNFCEYAKTLVQLCSLSKHYPDLSKFKGYF